MTARNWRGLGCAALIGAAVAFPAGVMFAGRDGASRKEGKIERRAPKAATARNFYSPVIAKDPYVIDQQRKLVEALELQCRRSGENCAEAKQSREWLDQQDAGD